MEDIAGVLVDRGYRPDGDAFPTGRPDRATIPLRDADDRPLVAKPYPAGGGAETFAAMQELWRSSFGERRHPPGLPRPVEYIERPSVLVMERLEGRPLLELGNPPDELVDAALELLASLHASDATPAKRRSASGVVRSIRRKAARTSELDATLAAPFARLVDALETARPAGAPLAPGHGDFSVRNVLVATDRLALIDWDRFRLADPARDVAYLGAWSWARARRDGERGDWALLDRCATTYDRLRPEVHVQQRIGFYVAAGLGRIAHALVEIWHEDATVAADLLAEAERWVS